MKYEALKGVSKRNGLEWAAETGILHVSFS